MLILASDISAGFLEVKSFELIKNGLSKESIIKIFEEQDEFNKTLNIRERCEIYCGGYV